MFQVVFANSPRFAIAAEINVGILASNIFAKCLFGHSNDIDNDYSTCQANGIKYLREGEAIGISINPLGAEVMMYPEYTYFGAYLLGSN